MYIVQFLFGYAMAALAWYLNHRFVFHGKLGKLPILKEFKSLHTIHHRKAYATDRNEYILIPAWGHTLLLCISAPVLYLSWAMWLGCVCFAVVYGLRHYRMHNGDTDSAYGRHHFLHHTTHPMHNFSGVHPIIDKIFKTDVR